MASDWTAQALEPVLLHELTHIKRRDCLVELVQIVLQILYFYHPMVWLTNWTIRRERELACDDEVVRLCGGCPRRYVRSMVHAAEGLVHQRRQQLWGMAMAESFSDLGGRIRRMMRTDYRTNERYGSISLGAVVVLGLFCAGVSCGRQESSGVFTVGGDVKAPIALVQPLPSYTDEARETHTEGIILLQAVIRKNGSVDSFKVLKGLGHGLDESAIDTISKRWRFKPGTRNGVSVDVRANIEVSFRLY
jgi:TonB family protein